MPKTTLFIYDRREQYPWSWHAAHPQVNHKSPEPGSVRKNRRQNHKLYCYHYKLVVSQPARYTRRQSQTPHSTAFPNTRDYTKSWPRLSERRVSRPERVGYFISFAPSRAEPSYCVEHDGLRPGASARKASWESSAGLIDWPNLEHNCVDHFVAGD